MSNLNYSPTLAENVLNLWSHMVLGRLFLGCAGGQTFKERVCAQMCSAANERNFTLLPSASSSVFILPAAASEAFGTRCYNECWAITECCSHTLEL